MPKSKTSNVTIETPSGPIKWNTGLQWKMRGKKAVTKYGDKPEILNAIMATETIGVVNMVQKLLARENQTANVIHMKTAPTRKAAKPAATTKKKAAPKTKTRKITRKAKAKPVPTTNGTRMRLIETLDLSHGHAISLIEVDGRTVLLGSSTEGSRLLTELG